MTLYDHMAEYARLHRIAPADLPAGELGKSIALFHQSLVETGLATEGPEENPRLTAEPKNLRPLHLSHFIVAFLPFNSVTDKNEINAILFEVYSFLQWLDKRGDPAGLGELAVDCLMRELAGEQSRCLELSHLLDAEAQRVLASPPEIVLTRATLFRVAKISSDRIHLHCPREKDDLSLRLSDNILERVRIGDHLDLVIGDTSERWVLLEASRVFPGPDEVPS
ncbi:MAG: hypothetical protein JSU88_10485 [Nitrospinaceae bacterium]|nr:MAG: hypothetical protein JSU88_10485 [Nitrospinaceae bacterium]